MTKPRAHIAPANLDALWETPVDVFQQLDEEFGPFDMDAFASVGQNTSNIILGRGGRICIAPSPEALPGSTDPDNPNILHDAFEHPWQGKIFINPPYVPPQLLYASVAKAVQEVQYDNAKLVVALLPVRTGGRWWQDYVCLGATRRGLTLPKPAPPLHVVRFFRGRLKFGGADNVAPFASCVVVWKA